MDKPDESAVQSIRLDARGPFVFVCEHASKRIPDEYNNLGVTQAVSESHAAWDIGALELVKQLSERFDSPLVASRVSRLVYDCNRAPESPTAIVTRSEHDTVPGNLNLTPDMRQQRIDSVYRPFEKQITELLDRRSSLNIETTLVTVHSFTPVMRGVPRAVEIGVLHDSDSCFADNMLRLAASLSSRLIKRNQPYGPDDDVTHTLKLHALPRNMHNVMLEVRNDLLMNTDDVSLVAEQLHDLLRDTLQACTNSHSSINQG